MKAYDITKLGLTAEQATIQYRNIHCVPIKNTRPRLRR